MRLLAATVTSATNYLTVRHSLASFLWWETDGSAYMFGRYHCMNEIKDAGHCRDLMKTGKH